MQTRRIFLDTETTGLEPRLGHRVIEIACVEMKSRRLTGRHLHHYLNPDREVDAGAQAIHGIDNSFLEDKPRFKDIAREFMAFIADAELVIHNAPFDIGFLDMELARLDLPATQEICARVCDTLKMARERRPGKRNSLDALCEHYQIDNAHRTLHGALLDAELLADVYLAMTRGQESLMMDMSAPLPKSASHTSQSEGAARTRPPLRVLRASAEERAAHAAALEHIRQESGGLCLFQQESRVEDDGNADDAGRDSS
ncbi:MAG: DNA polymerase III subunit epsilon [Zoogloeaceae bacterium]|jgi:DNA polymerase-3 subunit epsilon|nr:DNA polymerase III subunit epsilon [Zoogloeaceae bacterium]